MNVLNCKHLVCVLNSVYFVNLDQFQNLLSFSTLKFRDFVNVNLTVKLSVIKS